MSSVVRRYQIKILPDDGRRKSAEARDDIDIVELGVQKRDGFAIIDVTRYGFFGAIRLCPNGRS
jgi:hypothetical protein